MLKPYLTPARRRAIRVPDGGTVYLDFTPPLSDTSIPDSTPILISTHGLTGGSHESYVRNVLSVVTSPKSRGGLGWRAVVINFRGCAGTPLTSSQLYHGGWTDDIRSSVLYLSHMFPDAPLTGIGFSLGANALAKYLGEEGEACPVKAGVVLGNPWDLLRCHWELSSSFMGDIYSRAMASNLR